jgi:hypothetical protein
MFMPFTDDPESRGILNRQHAPHHSVDQAEDRGIRADSQRDGECRDYGEGRRLRECARRETEVLGEIVQ